MKINVLLAAWVCLFIGRLQAQVISIEEITKRKNQQVDLEHAIVDINSTIKVQVNRDALLSEVGKNVSSDTELVEKLAKLNFVLENQIAILQVLDESVKKADETDAIANLGKYSELMDAFYERLEGDEALRARVNDLFNEHRANRATIDRKVYPTVHVYVLKKLASDQADILNELRNSGELKGVRLQVVAILNTRSEYGRRVHVENFDQYALGEFYEVPRWVTTFSDDDLRAFERNKALATTLNEMVEQNAGGVGELLKSSLRSVNCFTGLVAEYQRTIDERHSIFEADQETARRFLDGVLDELVTVSQPLVAISALTPESPLQRFNSMQEQFLAAVEKLPANIEALVADLPPSLRTRQALTTLVNSTQDCLALLAKDSATVAEIFSLTSNLLSPLKESASNATEIGEEVFSYAVGDIPDSGFIELRTTGRRGNGDELVIKLIARTRQDSVARASGTVLERITLKLQQVSAYLEPQVAVIITSPFNRSGAVTIQRNFQFAPSGSLVVKFGSRASRAWNFINPGIGFNMSAPDFDLDGTPDAAVGGVVTVLQDVLSAGLSYNTNTDSPLLFFGLSLPFANFGFPVANAGERQ